MSQTASAGSAPAEPVVLVRGAFRSLEHASSGRAVILELADGTRYLRFETLSTSNGPDLRVYSPGCRPIRTGLPTATTS